MRGTPVPKHVGD